MTPERLTILIVSELHKEGISPNLENVASEQVQHTGEKLLKLLGGLSESEPAKALPPVPPRQAMPRGIESPTQMMPTVQPSPRYDWGQANVSTAHHTRP